jgi:anti-anti-sigma factor
MALTLVRHRDAGATTVGASGDIDLSTVGELDDELAAAVGSDAATVIVDLSAVTFIDSAGISALLRGRRAADEHGQDFRVTGAAGPVRQVLELTGVWTHLSKETG